jgi:hypothetical protein
LTCLYVKSLISSSKIDDEIRLDASEVFQDGIRDAASERRLQDSTIEPTFGSSEDSNCEQDVYVGIKIPSPNKWLAYFISVCHDSYGSRITDIFYSINSETYKRMEQSQSQINQQRAVTFRMEELDEIAGDHPNVGVLPIKFFFTLVNTVPDFQLQRLDNRLALDLWSAAVNRQSPTSTWLWEIIHFLLIVQFWLHEVPCWLLSSKTTQTENQKIAESRSRTSPQPLLRLY